MFFFFVKEGFKFGKFGVKAKCFCNPHGDQKDEYDEDSELEIDPDFDKPYDKFPDDKEIVELQPGRFFVRIFYFLYFVFF